MAKEFYGAHTYGRLNIIGAKISGTIIVGKYCSIAEEVRALLSGDHNMSVISTYPFYHRRMPIAGKISTPRLPETQRQDVETNGTITVGNDVWLGHGSIIFRNVTIGDGACIGAFSTITKDIPPYSVVVGHSRVLRQRFSPGDIGFLLDLKWWDFDDDVVGEIAPILHTSDVGLLRQWAKDRELYHDPD